MSVPNLPVAPNEQMNREGNALVVQSVQQQLGMSSDEIANARVAAVENHLLKLQDSISDEISGIDSLIKEKKKDLLSKDNEWKSKAKDEFEDKFTKELTKVSFGTKLAITVSSYTVTKKDSSTDHDQIGLIAYLANIDAKSRGYSSDGVNIGTSKAKIPAEAKKIITKLTKEIEPLISKKEELQQKLLKISGKLANLDREERQAKALLVASKVNSYEGGAAFMEVITGNMPEI